MKTLDANFHCSCCGQKTPGLMLVGDVQFRCCDMCNALICADVTRAGFEELTPHQPATVMLATFLYAARKVREDANRSDR